MNNLPNDKPTNVTSYNSSTLEERLGFAKRDSFVTDRIATPMVMNRLGRDVANFMGTRDSRYLTPDSNVGRISTVWDTNHYGWKTVPGIAVYDFQRIYALRDQFLNAETADIYKNKWMDIRIVNNAARDIQGSDMQALNCASMEIKLHLANIRRILNVMQKVVSHQLNAYYDPVVLLDALGFPMSLGDIEDNWEHWWRNYNNRLVSRLNAIRWFNEDFVPGGNRWAGLCREIYKDTPIYTDYTQIYLFRPETLWFMRAAFDREHNVYQWTWTEKKYLAKDYPSPHTNDGVWAFEQYLGMVGDLINETFYDDSAADIIALLNTIVERHLSDAVKCDYFAIPKLDFEGEDVPLTYDFHMQMALHNATIIPDYKLSAPTIDPAADIMSQQLVLSNNFGDFSGTYSSHIATFTKVIDLPWFGASVDDFINATQWTVTVSDAWGGDTPSPATEFLVPPGCIGTDFLSHVTIYTLGWNNDLSAYDIKRVNCDHTQMMMMWNTEDMTFNPSDMADLLQHYQLWMSFENAPLIYYESMQGYYSSVDQQHKMMGFLGNTEVLYAGDAPTLKEIHSQFIRNFWGYPIKAEPAALNLQSDSK
jgi:hypothetical protein